MIRCVVAFAVVVFALHGLCSATLGDDFKVFLMAGQSNMTGTAFAENLPADWKEPQDDVWIWLDRNVDGDGDWQTLKPGHGWGTHAPRPDEPDELSLRDGKLVIGPELSLGRALADAYPNHRIALIKHGDGGRNLASDFHPENLGPPDSDKHMWSGLLQKTSSAFEALADEGHAYEVEGFFFSLGGGDSRNLAIPFSEDPEEIAAGEAAALARGEAYGENLTTLIAAVRNEFSDSLPFVMPLMIPETTPLLERAYPGFRAVREGQLDVVANVPSVGGFEIEGLTVSDGIHYDALGQIEFGQRFASTYLDLVTLPDFDMDGIVGFGDFLILSTNFSQAGSFEDGDANFDGLIDFKDFLKLSDEFGQTVSPSGTASVPEPAVGCWWGVATLLIIRWSPKRRAARQ